MLSDAYEKGSSHETQKANPMVITGREFNKGHGEQPHGLLSWVRSYVVDLLENT